MKKKRKISRKDEKLVPLVDLKRLRRDLVRYFPFKQMAYWFNNNRRKAEWRKRSVDENIELILQKSRQIPMNPRHPLVKVIEKSLSASQLRKIYEKRVKELKKGQLSTNELVNELSHYFLGLPSPIEKRKEELENVRELHKVKECKFLYFCGVCIPREVFMIIFSYVPRNYHTLCNVGRICKSFYIILLKFWDLEGTQISKFNIYRVSLLALVSTKTLSIRPNMTKNEIEYLSKTIRFENIRKFILQANSGSRRFFRQIQEFNNLFKPFEKVESFVFKIKDEHMTRYYHPYSFEVMKDIPNYEKIFPNVRNIETESNDIVVNYPKSEKRKIQKLVWKNNHFRIPTNYIQSFFIEYLRTMSAFSNLRELVVHFNGVSIHRELSNNCHRSFPYNFTNLFSLLQKTLNSEDYYQIPSSIKKYVIHVHDSGLYPSKKKKEETEPLIVFNSKDRILQNILGSAELEELHILYDKSPNNEPFFPKMDLNFYEFLDSSFFSYQNRVRSVRLKLPFFHFSLKSSEKEVGRKVVDGIRLFLNFVRMEILCSETCYEKFVVSLDCCCSPCNDSHHRKESFHFQFINDEYSRRLFLTYSPHEDDEEMTVGPYREIDVMRIYVKRRRPFLILFQKLAMMMFEEDERSRFVDLVFFRVDCEVEVVKGVWNSFLLDCMKQNRIELGEEFHFDEVNSCLIRKSFL